MRVLARSGAPLAELRASDAPHTPARLTATLLETGHTLLTARFDRMLADVSRAKVLYPSKLWVQLTNCCQRCALILTLRARVAPATKDIAYC